MTVLELNVARNAARRMAIATASLLLMSSALCLWAEDRTSTARDAKLIRQVQQLSVSQLDVALPPLAFEKWLRVEAGADAEFHWEVNDCAEQATADRGVDFPVCVEAQADMNDHRTIVVSIRVSTLKKGAFAKPTLYFAKLVTPGTTIDLHQLSDFPAALIKTHQPPPVEVAK
jgi:hypothetical protein